jgi:phosphatidylglycerophosphatase A
LEKIWGKDAKKITADEVLGILTTFFLIPINLKTLILGFFLFRFYDIFKLPFLRKVEKLEGGLGVVLDDVLAGVLANLTLRIILILWQ